MLLADIARDASLAGEALVDPVAGAAGRGRPLTALGLAVVAAVAFAAVAAPRTDFAAAAALALDRSPKAAEMTPHDREEALALAAKLGRMRLWTDASLGTALAAAAVAGALWAAFRLAGARPAFRATFAVAAHGMLPGAVERLLAIPAALAHAPLRPSDLSGRLPFSPALLLPSSAASLLPPGAPAPLVAALGGLDLFALWAVVLVAGGMASASGASRARALAATSLLWVGYVGTLGVALAPGGP